MPTTSVINRPAVILHRPPQRAAPWQIERHEATPAQSALPDGRNIPVRPQEGQQVPWARFGRSAGPERDAPRRAPEPPRVETWSPLQQVPAQATGAPQAQQQEPARNPAPPPVFMRRETPQVVRPMPQREQLPQNARPEAFASAQSHEMRQEHREPPHEVRRKERGALPGQPANRLYRRPANPN